MNRHSAYLLLKFIGTKQDLKNVHFCSYPGRPVQLYTKTWYAALQSFQHLQAQLFHISINTMHSFFFNFFVVCLESLRCASRVCEVTVKISVVNKLDIRQSHLATGTSTNSTRFVCK